MCDWGRVLVWEPPERVVCSWQLQGDWSYDPDPARGSEVEVRFVAEAPDRTRVELEHRHFDRHADGADSVRTGVNGPGGWGHLLELFAARTQAD